MSAWEKAITEAAGISGEVPLVVLVALTFFVIFFGLFLPFAHVFSFLERKTVADLQARVGPNRIGLTGFFQPLSDFIKLMQKSFLVTNMRRTDLWLCFLAMALCSSMSFLPLGSNLLMVDVDISLFLPVMTILFVCLAMVYLGLERGTFQDLLAGIRFFSQGISGAFTVVIVLLSAGIRVGGFSWTAVNTAQGAFPHQWAGFSDPFQLVGFVLFVVCGQIIFSFRPFDAAYEGGLSGMSGHRHVLMGFLRLYAKFFWAIVSVVIFCGGWNSSVAATGVVTETLLAAGVVLVKAFFLMLLVAWVASVTPRMRANTTTRIFSSSEIAR
jgi:NADH-quinone oxidoreductase subunit H